MSLPQPNRLYSPQEYYDFERAAQYKSDYYKSEIFDMPGAISRHCLINANLIRIVGNAIESANSPCRIYDANLRVKVAATSLRCYPDATIFCEPLERDTEDQYGETYLNPTVVFEILSPSAEAYDRGLKGQSYRQMSSLRAYVLISQDRPYIEAYVRDSDGPWNFVEIGGLSSSLPIGAITFSLSLARLYANVDFDETAR